jgi:hypothetical protein
VIAQGILNSDSIYPLSQLARGFFSFVALIRVSSAVERPPVKQRDIGSDPILGAKLLELIPVRSTVRTARSERANGGQNPSPGASIEPALGSAKWQPETFESSSELGSSLPPTVKKR